MALITVIPHEQGWSLKQSARAEWANLERQQGWTEEMIQQLVDLMGQAYDVGNRNWLLNH